MPINVLLIALSREQFAQRRRIMHSISTDLFTVIGLASNIVQFVDSSSDLMRGGLELYRSLDGATSSSSIVL